MDNLIPSYTIAECMECILWPYNANKQIWHTHTTDFKFMSLVPLIWLIDCGCFACFFFTLFSLSLVLLIWYYWSIENIAPVQLKISKVRYLIINLWTRSKKGEYIDFNHILRSLPYCMHQHQTCWSSLSIRFADLFTQFIKNMEMTLENYDCGTF